jgi:hypothetical protein
VTPPVPPVPTPAAVQARLLLRHAPLHPRPAGGRWLSPVCPPRGAPSGRLPSRRGPSGQSSVPELWLLLPAQRGAAAPPASPGRAAARPPAPEHLLNAPRAHTPLTSKCDPPSRPLPPPKFNAPQPPSAHSGRTASRAAALSRRRARFRFPPCSLPPPSLAPAAARPRRAFSAALGPPTHMTITFWPVAPARPPAERWEPAHCPPKHCLRPPVDALGPLPGSTPRPRPMPPALPVVQALMAAPQRNANAANMFRPAPRAVFTPSGAAFAPHNTQDRRNSPLPAAARRRGRRSPHAGCAQRAGRQEADPWRGATRRHALATRHPCGPGPPFTLL